MNKRIVGTAAYAALAGTLVIHGFLFWNARALIARGYPDFTIFYSAGLMVRHGLGHHLYDDALQYRIQRSFAPKVEIRQGPLPYMHPPFEAVIFAPLTLLSYPVAFAVWDLLSLGMLALVPRLLRPHIAILKDKPPAVWVLGLLAFFPVFSVLLQGQDVILLLLLQTLTFLALKRRSDFLSGCWLGLGSFKVHLVFPLMVVIVLGWKRPRVFLGFAAVCLFLGAISVAVGGWPQAVRYPEYVLHLEQIGANGAIMPMVVPNLRGLLEGWRVSAGFIAGLRVATVALSLVVLSWVVAVSRRYVSQPMDLHFALATTVSVLVSYHAFASDLVLLVIPLLVALTYLGGAQIQLPRDLPFLLPVGLLLSTPVYAVLLFRVNHANLLALVLLLWLWGIQQRIKEGSQSSRGEENSSLATLGSSCSSRG